MTKPAASYTKTRWKENALFFVSALRQYKEIGMFLPSSGTVAESVAGLIPLESMQVVVEVGSGTGRISRAVHGTLPQEAHLFCVEKNTEFCEFLRQSLPNSNVTVLNMAAEDLLLSKESPIRPGSADCVILSLAPLFGSAEVRQRWAEMCGGLVREGGYVVIHQFIPVIGQYFLPATWRKFSRNWFLDFPPFRVDVLQKCVVKSLA